MAGRFLDVLLPTNSEAYTAEQSQINRQADAVRAYRPSTKICEAELRAAVFTMGKKKAPGKDEITAEMMQQAWPVVKHFLLHVMNDALRAGKFPTEWKVGIVKHLYKGNGKDPTKPKSYRPLTLLPVIGKIYEKILNKRLVVKLETAGALQEKQFGFRIGRGTEDALATVLKTVEDTHKKYALGIFLDIAGAFDNDWWAKIIVELQRFGIRGQEIEVIKDYFRNRRAILRLRETMAEKTLTVGCPQGSVLGPTLWNVLFHSFLRLRLPEGCTSFAYADDGLILVTAGSRAELEDVGTEVCTRVQQWSKEIRLHVSVEKTKIMLLKGILKGRAPLIIMGNKKLEYVKQIKYLGVILDERLNFRAHARYAAKRAVDSFYRIKRLAQANWGLRFKELQLIYKGVGEAILLYGASAWAHRLDNTTYAAVINRAQRAMLLTVCRAYRTVATDSLPVLAGIMPADLQARKRKDLYIDKRSEVNNRAEIKDRYQQIWQERWTNSDKGRPVHDIWPNVNERQEMPIEIGHYDSQFITGHGNFRQYLHRFGLRDEALCDACQEVETPRHIVYDCSKYIDERTELVMTLNAEHIEFDLRVAANTLKGYEILSGWFRQIGRLREQERI